MGNIIIFLIKKFYMTIELHKQKQKNKNRKKPEKKNKLHV